ncbi:MAG: HU family DNA-binding protein, partial [Tannerella sp.]|nr:HU family DNA-binding protein [Tannerella sp.]
MDERFSLYNIAEMLSEKTGIEQQDAEKFLDELIAVLNERIRSDHQVQVRGLGVFKIILVKERESVHVNTGERIVISEHHKLTFIPEKELKEMVNKPFSMFSPEQLPDRPSSESSLVTDMHYEDSESEEDTVTQPSQDEETSLIAPPSGVAPSPPPGEA